MSTVSPVWLLRPQVAGIIFRSDHPDATDRLLMQIQHVEKLKPGDILGKSLFNSRGELLLASGYELSEEMIALVRRRKIMYVHIMTEITKDIQPQEIISDTLRNMANQQVGETFEAVAGTEDLQPAGTEGIKDRLQKDSRFKNIVQMPSLKRIVSSILEEVFASPSVMFSSIRMRAEDDGADYEHAIDTTVLSILMGRSFRYNQTELRQLGIASMLHDIGKVILGRLRRKKSYELNADERMLLREHPVYSMLILRENAEGSYVEQTTVLQHHEQLNGNGFPRNLTASDRPPIRENQEDRSIHRHAQILGVTNVYDNLITGDFDGVVHTPEEAVTKIVNGRAGAWNSHVVRILVKTVQCYPVGVSVRIKDNHSKRFVGYHGVVAKENPTDQNKPCIILTHNSQGKEIVPNMVDFKDELEMQLEIDV